MISAPRNHEGLKAPFQMDGRERLNLQEDQEPPRGEPPEPSGGSQGHRCPCNPVCWVVGPEQGQETLHPQKDERQELRCSGGKRERLSSLGLVRALQARRRLEQGLRDRDRAGPRARRGCDRWPGLVQEGRPWDSAVMVSVASRSRPRGLCPGTKAEITAYKPCARRIRAESHTNPGLGTHPLSFIRSS